VRHKSGRYYVRAYARGKEVWKSLKTAQFSVAESRLADFLKQHRASLAGATGVWSADRAHNRVRISRVRATVSTATASRLRHVAMSGHCRSTTSCRTSSRTLLREERRDLAAEGRCNLRHQRPVAAGDRSDLVSRAESSNERALLTLVTERHEQHPRDFERGRQRSSRLPALRVVPEAAGDQPSTGRRGSPRHAYRPRRIRAHFAMSSRPRFGACRDLGAATYAVGRAARAS
jgi:hypothetical protein